MLLGFLMLFSITVASAADGSCAKNDQPTSQCLYVADCGDLQAAEQCYLTADYQEQGVQVITLYHTCPVFEYQGTVPVEETNLYRQDKPYQNVAHALVRWRQ